MKGAGVSLKLSAALLATACVASAHAADFDASKPLLCASVIAVDCVANGECVSGTPFEIGAPRFMRLDFAKKRVIGQKRTSIIQSMETSESQMVLRGIELGYAWTITIDQTDGRMVTTLTNVNGVFAVFGSCTPP